MSGARGKGGLVPWRGKKGSRGQSNLRDGSQGGGSREAPSQCENLRGRGPPLRLGNRKMGFKRGGKGSGEGPRQGGAPCKRRRSSGWIPWCQSARGGAPRQRLEKRCGDSECATAHFFDKILKCLYDHLNPTWVFAVPRYFSQCHNRVKRYCSSPQ